MARQQHGESMQVDPSLFVSVIVLLLDGASLPFILAWHRLGSPGKRYFGVVNSFIGLLLVIPFCGSYARNREEVATFMMLWQLLMWWWAIHWIAAKCASTRRHVRDVGKPLWGEMCSVVSAGSFGMIFGGTILFICPSMGLYYCIVGPVAYSLHLGLIELRMNRDIDDTESNQIEGENLQAMMRERRSRRQ